MAELSELLNRRLSLAQYLSVLGQEYHLAINAPLNFQIAADRCDDPSVVRFLLAHAAEVDGHHEWAAQDLADLGASVPPPNAATLRLLEHVRSLACGGEPHRVLALCLVSGQIAPTLDVERVIPPAAGSAIRFVLNHREMDLLRAAEARAVIDALPAERREQVLHEAALLSGRFVDFYASAAGPVRDDRAVA